MSAGDSDRIDHLLQDLRQRAKNATTVTVALDRRDAVALADELSRLLQSSHRLRRQNAKLRKRIERLKAGQPDVVDGADLDDDREG